MTNLRAMEDDIEAACWSLDQLSVVQVAGSDAIKVLNGLCTAPLATLAVGKCHEAFFTDDRGRVICHCVVAREENSAWIVGQNIDAPKLVQHIDRFIFREDASPKDLSADYKGWLLDGHAASLKIDSLFDSDSSAKNAVKDTIRQIRFQDQTVRLISMPVASQHSCVCIAPGSISAAWSEELKRLGFEFRESDSLESLRIANFWPVAGSEINDRTLPQELARDVAAISFTKGCYLGQETVARLDAMGEVQRKLCRVTLPVDVEAHSGQSLMNGEKEVGKLTSIAPHASGQHRHALAYMRRGNFAAGTAFQVGGSVGHVIETP